AAPRRVAQRCGVILRLLRGAGLGARGRRADEGLIAKTVERPGLQQVIAACQARTVGAVIVTKLDRLSRRTRDLPYLVENVCDHESVALHSLAETVDTASASGRFFLRIMGAL